MADSVKFIALVLCDMKKVITESIVPTCLAMRKTKAGKEGIWKNELKWEKEYGKKSSNLQAVTSSSFAIAWLEATFPDFVSEDTGVGKLLALKAHPYVPFDASLALQNLQLTELRIVDLS
ncbi:hypothetical protein ACLOJK_018564 [Asimina triloba]